MYERLFISLFQQRVKGNGWVLAKTNCSLLINGVPIIVHTLRAFEKDKCM